MCFITTVYTSSKDLYSNFKSLPVASYGHGIFEVIRKNRFFAIPRPSNRKKIEFPVAVKLSKHFTFTFTGIL